MLMTNDSDDSNGDNFDGDCSDDGNVDNIPRDRVSVLC